MHMVQNLLVQFTDMLAEKYYMLCNEEIQMDKKQQWQYYGHNEQL